MTNSKDKRAEGMLYTSFVEREGGTPEYASAVRDTRAYLFFKLRNIGLVTGNYEAPKLTEAGKAVFGSWLLRTPQDEYIPILPHLLSTVPEQEHAAAQHQVLSQDTKTSLVSSTLPHLEEEARALNASIPNTEKCRLLACEEVFVNDLGLKRVLASTQFGGNASWVTTGRPIEKVNNDGETAMLTFPFFWFYWSELTDKPPSSQQVLKPIVDFDPKPSQPPSKLKFPDEAQEDRLEAQDGSTCRPQ